MVKKVMVLLVTGFTLSAPMFALPQHEPMKGMDMHGEHSEKMPSASALKPAEGAKVKILSPKEGQAFKSDEVAVQFKLTKGQKGHHVHAYVDGELMGMFESDKGTLTGIRPGRHVLELRVVAEDHQTELDARDKVRFVVKR